MQFNYKKRFITAFQKDVDLRTAFLRYTHLQLNLKNKINNRAEQKQTHRYEEHFDSCHRGRRLEGMG